MRMLDSDIWRVPKNIPRKDQAFFFQIDGTLVIRTASIAPVESTLQVRKVKCSALQQGPK